MNYYNEIKNKLIDNEIYEKVKDYSKERHRVITYYKIGKLLNKAGNKYGENIIGKYSERLVREVGKKYNRRTLFRMKQFYTIFSNEKVSTLWTQMTWSHIRLLFSLNYDEINYYIQSVINNHLSVRELDIIIKSKEYERIPEETKIKFINQDKLEAKDLIPNPIIIKNNKDYEIITEKVLHQLIIDNIEDFMKELGNSFCFIASEYKIKLGDNNSYIDLLLFNFEYNCFVVVELKVTHLKKEHIGQIEVYMNYIDKNLRKTFHDKTIGIIICKKENGFVIEYCSDKRIIAREYQIL